LNLISVEETEQFMNATKDGKNKLFAFNTLNK